jgi:hypothetical protein
MRRPVQVPSSVNRFPSPRIRPKPPTHIGARHRLHQFLDLGFKKAVRDDERANRRARRHSGMRRRDKVAKLLCAEGAGPESIPPGIDAAPWILRCAIAHRSSRCARPGMTMRLDSFSGLESSSTCVCRVQFAVVSSYRPTASHACQSREPRLEPDQV